MTAPLTESSTCWPEVRVSRKGEERLRSGHAWVFGDDLREVPPGLPPGQWAWVRSRSGESLGTATINLGSRIALRRVSRADILPTEAFLGDRLREASGGVPRMGWAGNAPFASSTPRAIFSPG